MFDNIPTPNAVYARIGALLLLSVFSGLPADAQPSQSPLLAAQSGAKPNLMISLDNSGSMAFNFHETYGVRLDLNDLELRQCPANRWSNLTGAWQGGMADFYNNNRCYDQNRTSSTSRTNVSVSYSPPRFLGAWSAQRSADVNPVYYNPRTRYLPRVSANGSDLIPNDGVVWVSNQTSAAFQYRTYRSNNQIQTRHSMYAGDLDGSGTITAPAGYTLFYSIASDWRTPTHIAYSSTNSSTPGFTYSYCQNILTVNNLQVGCTNRTDVTVQRNISGNITLPAGHNRTDCSGNVCTNAQEVANIMNWYRYYAFRAPAVATAIGQAIANPDYDRQLRLGYLSINRREGDSENPINQTPGVTVNNTGLLRGVRLHDRGTADTQRLYTWLYDQDGSKNRNSNGGANTAFNATNDRLFAPYGGTPLHNAITRVANYFRLPSEAVENPWATDPSALSSTNNPEMSCRRSFNLLFSDGAWNDSTITGQDFDNTNGPQFARTNSSGASETFRYFANGVNTLAGRRQYTPFPSTGTGGLADLTAQYFWHIDMRAGTPGGGLANNVRTRAGQPTFWQNMATYTVGYLIRPTGEVPGNTSGLTFEQIRNYQAAYARDGFGPAPKPTWATGELNAASAQTKVDDFIQAGFTGGGKGFSARTADDVRSIFDSIIREITNASGEDAGVAVSTATTDLSTIAGRLKYGVSYGTLENTGDIEARELDELGNEVGTRWVASERLPEPSSRRIFTMSGTASPINFVGNVSSLPLDVRSALRTGPDAGRVPDDERFINYLRGLDPVTDTAGVLFRQRASKLGAMVNPPSIFMGGDRDFAYDLSGAVTGAASYLSYANAKRSLPASLFVSTNAGMMHAFNAEAGDEMAAFMPRRSLRRMLNYADADYLFEYTLDGPLSEHDIYDGANWNHLAVGTGGRGERLLYAVRSPLNSSGTPNRTPGQNDFLWETGPDLIDNTSLQLGHITNPVRSGQTENGQWIVVANNGHYNGRIDGTRSGLVVLDAMTGSVIRTIALPATYSAGRGLSGVTLVRNADKRVVAAYAGDANGNLWRFNLRGAPASWGVSYNRPMFTTANNRPIYGSPAWQVHPNGGTVVVVATGMLLQDSDLGDTAVSEAIYGIWDPTVIGQDDAAGFTTVIRDDLLTQSVLPETAVVAGAGTFFRSSRNAIDWNVHRGWTMPLGQSYQGERSLDLIRNLGSSVIITTTVLRAVEDPDAEMCSVSNLPANYIYILNALDGATARSFDIDGDGRLDNVSVVLVAGGGYSRGMSVANIIRSVSLTDVIRERLSIDGSTGESPAEIQKCSPIRARLLGTESGSFAAGVACEVAGWSRNQYQLSRPPSN